MPKPESEPHPATAIQPELDASPSDPRSVDPRALDADLVAVRPGLPRGLVIAVGVAAVLVAALGLQAFAEIVGPVFLALLLSIVVQPVRRFPARHGLPAWLGTALSLVAVYAMVVGLVAILVISGVQLAGLLADYQPQFESTVKSLSTKLEAAGISQAQLQAVASQANPGKIVGLVADLLGGVAGILGSITFLILLLFFTVTDAATFATNVARISPAGRRLGETFQLFATGSRRYLAVATIFGAGVALLDVVALYILDIRYAWLWGLLAFITNYIPNVGFIIGLVPPTIVALVDHDAKTAITVVIVYCVLNIIIQSVIQPRVVGSSVGLSPTLSFLSLIVWAAILGGVGAFLAVPATLFVKALFFDVDPERRWVIPLISSSGDADPAEDPPPDAKRAADDAFDQPTEPAPVAPAKSANPE